MRLGIKVLWWCVWLALFSEMSAITGYVCIAILWDCLCSAIKFCRTCAGWKKSTGLALIWWQQCCSQDFWWGWQNFEARGQGRNEVRWRLGQEAILAPPCSKQVFRKQMYCIEESTCDIVGTFWHPRSHSAPGELRSPCYAPARGTGLICGNITDFHKFSLKEPKGLIPNFTKTWSVTVLTKILLILFAIRYKFVLGIWGGVAPAIGYGNKGTKKIHLIQCQISGDGATETLDWSVGKTK